MWYIVTMADAEAASADTTLACFRGYADCVEGAVEKGGIIGGNAYEKGEIKTNAAMQKVYEMGKWFKDYAKRPKNTGCIRKGKNSDRKGKYFIKF